VHFGRLRHGHVVTRVAARLPAGAAARTRDLSRRLGSPRLPTRNFLKFRVHDGKLTAKSPDTPANIRQVIVHRRAIA
jgi:hypothetical protein